MKEAVGTHLVMVRAYLAEAEQHILLGERHIARHIEIIDELKRAGHCTELAIDLLGTYRDLRATHISHRHCILKELES